MLEEQLKEKQKAFEMHDKETRMKQNRRHESYALMDKNHLVCMHRFVVCICHIPIHNDFVVKLLCAA